MKTCRMVLAISLAMPGVAGAEIVTRVFEAEIHSVASTDGPTDVEAHLQAGQLLAFTVQYNTEAPGQVEGNTGNYYLVGRWQFDLGGGHQAEAGFGSVAVVNDHPSWDAFTFVADPTNLFGGVGGSRLLGASLVLSDASRTALASPALVPLPPFTAFTSGEFELSFTDLYSEKMGSTRVQGRIVSIDRNPLASQFRCHGFAAPMDRQVRHQSGGNRVFPLKATLLDASDRAVGPEGLLAAPIVRVVHESPAGARGEAGALQHVGLGVGAASFVFRDGQWKYNLQIASPPPAGSYLVAITSPDQNQYVIDPQCSVEILVGAGG